jgi:anti-anti-sigma factor
VDRAELSITVHRTAEEVVLRLAGEIDMLTAAQLSNTVNEVLGDPPPRIVLDLGGVTFCDSQAGHPGVFPAARRVAPRACWSTHVGDF